MPHIFTSFNKATGQTDLIKADSRSQATKFINSNFTISRADPLQVAEHMGNGAKLYDATSIVLDKAETEEGMPQDSAGGGNTAETLSDTAGPQLDGASGSSSPQG